MLERRWSLRSMRLVDGNLETRILCLFRRPLVGLRGDKDMGFYIYKLFETCRICCCCAMGSAVFGCKIYASF